MHKNKTLIILTPGFPENEADTTCLPAQQAFVKTLKQNNPDLNIILLAFQYPFIVSEYVWYGIKVITFNGRNRGKLNRVTTWLAVWQTLTRIKRENEVIGLLSFWLGECAFVGKYFAKRHKLTHYCWMLGQDARKRNNYVRRVRPQPEELIAISDSLAKEFFENYGIRPKHIIPNGIDTALYNTRVYKRTIDVLGVGSLIPLKQYDLFIEIISELTHTYPAIKGMICGKGPEENQLKLTIKDLKLDNNILLAGEKSHPEILQLMQQSKILLHTSSYEGFSAVLLEALYAGAHIISFVKPMDESFRHHYVVSTKQEMIEKLSEMLHVHKMEHDPVLPYSIQEVGEKVIRLFNR
jgi:glycosyltransferase involved in cell wall biosynthesis